MCGCLSASIFGWEFKQTPAGFYGIDSKENITTGPHPTEAEALEALRLAVRARAEARNRARMAEMGLI